MKQHKTTAQPFCVNFKHSLSALVSRLSHMWARMNPMGTKP